MNTSSFEINNAESFFHQMVKPQYESFLVKNSSSRHALLSTILLYHLYEWVNPGEKFTIERFIKRYPDSFHLADSFEMARDITNGFKHFKVKPTTTRCQSGFSSTFSNRFVRPLIIISPSGLEISADDFLKQMFDFWNEQIQIISTVKA